MLRSLLAMILCQCFSINIWVGIRRSFPYYVMISGFDPDDVPGVGTFFEFVDRIAYQPKRPSALARASAHRKGYAHPHPGILERIAKSIEEGNIFFT